MAIEGGDRVVYHRLLWQKCPLCGCNGVEVRFHGEGVAGTSTTFTCGLALFVDKATGDLYAIFSIRGKRIRQFIASPDDNLDREQVTTAIIDAIAALLITKDPQKKTRKTKLRHRKTSKHAKRGAKRPKRRAAVVA